MRSNGFVYGAAAGSVVRGRLAIHGTSGTIEGNLLNGEPIDAPDGELPHVVGPHRSIQESHVYEDIMQMVDWIREDKATIVTAEACPACHRNFRCGISIRTDGTGTRFTHYILILLVCFPTSLSGTPFQACVKLDIYRILGYS